MSHLLQILKKPLVTERAANMKAEMNKYVFRVALTSSKGDIKQAVEELFKVAVTAVHTMRVLEKIPPHGQCGGLLPSGLEKGDCHGEGRAGN